MGGEGEEEEEPSMLRQAAVFFFFVFFFIPVVVIVLSFLFGSMLAAAEEWDTMDGFYYVISMLCGLPNPLTDVNPDTDLGKFVDIVIALWSLAVAGCIIGIVGGMGIVGKFTTFAETKGFKFSSKVNAVLADELEAHMSITDGGEISFEQFKTLMATLSEKVGKSLTDDEIKDYFNAIDADGTGKIEGREVTVLKELFGNDAAVDMWLVKRKTQLIEKKLDVLIGLMDPKTRDQAVHPVS